MIILINLLMAFFAFNYIRQKDEVARRAALILFIHSCTVLILETLRGYFR